MEECSHKAIPKMRWHPPPLIRALMTIIVANLSLSYNIHREVYENEDIFLN